MKKFGLLLIALFTIGMVFQSCDDTETYAEQKAKERRWIQNYVSEHNIKVITESQFLQQDSTTNVDENEYVYFDDSGVYMQIIRRGNGTIMKNGEHIEILTRFIEGLVETGDTLTTTNLYGSDPDIMMCSMSESTITASFTQGSMLSNYGAAVPTGWLIPLKYIKLTPQLPNETLPKVKLIVPHSSGHSVASSAVAPYFYEITYQKKR